MRTYTTLDGRIVPSVTTLIGHLGVPQGVYRWRAKLMHQAGVDGVPYADSWSIGNEAAEWGSAVHERLAELVAPTTEWPAHGDTIHVAALRVMSSITTNGYTIVNSELQLVGDTYGGTIDLVLERDGRTTIADLKTGQAVYSSTGAQLGGYRRLWRNENGQRPVDLAVIHLPRGTDTVTWIDVDPRSADRMWQAVIDWTGTNPLRPNSNQTTKGRNNGTQAEQRHVQGERAPRGDHGRPKGDDSGELPDVGRADNGRRLWRVGRAGE